jgi:hypothetical protein
LYGLRTMFRDSSRLAPIHLIDLTRAGREIYEMYGFPGEIVRVGSSSADLKMVLAGRLGRLLCRMASPRDSAAAMASVTKLLSSLGERRELTYASGIASIPARSASEGLPVLPQGLAARSLARRVGMEGFAGVRPENSPSFRSGTMPRVHTMSERNSAVGFNIRRYRLPKSARRRCSRSNYFDSSGCLRVSDVNPSSHGCYNR